MTLNKFTVMWLVLGLGGLVGSYTSGFLTAHTELMVWVLAFYKLLGSLLGPLASRELPKA